MHIGRVSGIARHTVLEVIHESKDAEEIMLQYGCKHPVALRELARMMGYKIENLSKLVLSVTIFL